MLSTFISQGSRKVSKKLLQKIMEVLIYENTCYYDDDSEKSVMPASWNYFDTCVLFVCYELFSDSILHFFDFQTKQKWVGLAFATDYYVERHSIPTKKAKVRNWIVA